MSADQNNCARHTRIHWHCPTCRRAGAFLIPIYATVEELLKIKEDYHHLGISFCSGVAELGGCCLGIIDGGKIEIGVKDAGGFVDKKCFSY